MAEDDFEVAQTYSGPSISLSAEAEAQYERITRNLAEMTSGEIIRKVLSDGEVLRGYFGELGHFVQLCKQLLQASTCRSLTCACCRRNRNHWPT
jgi:hypothetical protein